MSIRKRLLVYVLGFFWIVMCVFTINLLGDYNLISFEIGTKILIFQFLPVHIVFSFFFLNKNKWLNCLLGFFIWVLLNRAIPLVNTYTLTEAGDTVSGVASMIVIYWIAISIIYECIYLIGNNSNRSDIPNS